MSFLRMTLATWAVHNGITSYDGPLHDSVVLCEKPNAQHFFFPPLVQVSHAAIIEHVTMPAGERNVVRTPYAQQVLRSIEAEGVHKKIGTDRMLALLRSALWFVKWREERIFVQVCGLPWKRPKAKDEYFVRRMSFMFAQERREDAPYERASDMCRRIFGLNGRHLRPRFVRLLPHFAELRDHMCDDSPALQGKRAIPLTRVAKDLWHYVRRITPFELFGGSKFNMRLVRWGIYQFVGRASGPLRGINLRPLATLWRLRSNDTFTRQMVLDWLKHLFSSVCVMWIRQRYYVSDQYCFNKESWRRMHKRPPARLKPKVIAEKVFASPLCLVPKSPVLFCEVRPLIPNRLPFQEAWEHKVAQKVLQLFLPPQVVPNLTECKRLIQSSSATWSVHLDVRYAYDMINQAFLWQLLNEQIKGSGATVHYVRINGSLTKVSPGSFPRNALVSDLTTTCFMSKERLLQILHKVIFDNYVYHQGRTYRLERGIPQGSSLSQLLCSFYLFKLIRPTFLPKGCLILRHTDDQLFLCSSKEECLKHMEDMQQQFVPWNWRKFKMSQREGKWCGIELSNVKIKKPE